MGGSKSNTKDITNLLEMEVLPVNSTSSLPVTDVSTFSCSANLKDIESQKAFLEKAGRERPAKFTSFWKEFGFIYSVVMSQVLTEYFTSGFNVIIPRITSDLEIPAAKQTWPAAAFPLVVSALLLPFGRLSDMYGGFPVYVAGVTWLTIWALVAGFSQSEVMLDLCRALQGIGPAAFLPSSLMLLGSIYRPGSRKNLTFAIYGAAAPLGFFLGVLVAGLCVQYASWAVYFWIGAGLTALTAVVAYFTIPSDVAERKKMGITMDWIGFILIPAALVAIVFAITDSAHAREGWLSPYILAVFFIGVALLGLVTYFEGWIMKSPLLPPNIFAVKYMKPLFVSLLISNGSLSIFMLYATLYMTKIMGAEPIQIVAWFLPMAIGGMIISTLGGFVLHLIPGTIIMIVAGVAYIIAPLLLAVAPQGADYWHFTFWSMICATIGIDTTFTVSNVFVTTSLPLSQQGVAGAIINSLVHLATALFLGCADVVAISQKPKGELFSYRSVFYFEIGLAMLSLIIMLFFVKINKAEAKLTVEEKLALESSSTIELVGMVSPAESTKAISTYSRS